MSIKNWSTEDKAQIIPFHCPSGRNPTPFKSNAMLTSGKRKPWPIAAIALTVLTLYYLYGFGGLRSGQANVLNSARSLLHEQQVFWKRLYPQILENRPQCEPVVNTVVGGLMINYDAHSDYLRPDRLEVNTTQTEELRVRHQSYLSAVRHSNYALPYHPNTQGVVMTAGGKYLPVVVVSIRMLRETGCKLPVEVFLATNEEWDAEICGQVFPRLNAHCVVLENIFDPDHKYGELEIHKYQYKIMSIVFSSFEDVLFLDADCFPIYDPTRLLDSEPFKETGLVIWPDFWYASESKSFFEVAQTAMPAINKRPASESGELLYSKRRHTNSLLLAMYYNFYGPDFYYPLQSQGAPGEGDKETFLWSAVVLDEPFYSVHERVQALGYHASDGSWIGSAMVQYDCVEDALRREDPVKPLFVHVNMPKIDPGQVFLNRSFGVAGPTKDPNGTMRRIWHKTENETIAFFGFDVERRLWGVVKDIACEYEGKFAAWRDFTHVCRQAEEYWEAVFVRQSPGGF